ncbi:Jlp1p [Sugiyamaella lignohabitans]|uniref:Jlp1p n=1 Tax=Sugiyamaella lignohabitans TaxID=796027 RepID=A0A167EM25_9ASCO|nr:Jlp1p [Sugiyamaella lignohabitans]ANB14238.1 Jlp1p [Sugiyamaella lignohabitans]
MAPSTTTTTTTKAADVPQYVLLKNKFKQQAQTHEGPSPWAEKYTEGPSYKPSKEYLKASGALDGAYKFDEITPQIGREYPEAQLRDILNDESKLRDLAITISRRGVVFFRNQDLTIEEQKTLALQLGKLTGVPETSGLHIHPTAPAGGFLKDGTDETDPEVSIISSKLGKELYLRDKLIVNKKRAANGWHSDITFEPVPSSYAILKVVEKPPTGGDTLWASGYALYEKLSPSFRAYLETLTGTYAQPGFKKAAEGKFEIYSGERGAPENVGDELTAVHPLIRTNPVTGWKSIFALGHHFTSINGLTDDESLLIKEYINELLYGSHDIQVRFKWGKNDVALWDNRSVYHTATNDYYEASEFERTGVRTVGIGERPFLDPKSKSRTEDLQESGVTV